MLLLLLLLLLPLLMLLPLLQLPPHLFLYLVPFTVSESISYLGKESMISLSLSLSLSFQPFDLPSIFLDSTKKTFYSN